MGKRILYVVPHRYNRCPGQRFRCEHFIPYLQNKGYSTTYSPLLSEWDDAYFYKKGAYFFKLIIVLKAFFRRIRDVRQASNYDIVFIYREAFMLGTTMFERAFAKKSCKIIFDFDDSIWLPDTSEGNQNLAWLKRPQKLNTICALADLVIAGNDFLAEYAKQYATNVVVIPTTINTNYHLPNTTPKKKDKICIGWTGTETTHKHLAILEPVLARLNVMFLNKLTYMIISNKPYNSSTIAFQWKQWSPETEITDLQDIDIGIMPLPNDEWSKGKCGFKGLQYMALEIPTIMSPVGVNTQIITDGVNGFLAETDDEWFDVLCELINNENTRKTIGTQGRKTIIKRYSVDAFVEKYIALFHKLV